MTLIRTRPGQQPSRRILLASHSRSEGCHHGIHPLCVRTGGIGRLLRMAQLCGCHHLHGLGDLLRRLDTVDPVFEFLKVRHFPAAPFLSSTYANALEKPSRISFSFDSVSADRAPSFRIVSRSPWCFACISASSCFSYSPILETSTASRYPR